jgi:hypothetical protein
MNPYQKMYTTLFNAVTDLIDLLESTSSLSPTETIHFLQQAQIKTEELYLELSSVSNE